MEGDKPKRQRFKRYPIGSFIWTLPKLQTRERKLFLFVAIDRTRKVSVAQLVDKADRRTAWSSWSPYCMTCRAASATILAEFGG